MSQEVIADRAAEDGDKPGPDVTLTETRSTLKRPSDKLLQRFRIEQIGPDTVGTFLTKGFSLAICCRSCPRVIEWTPHQLQARFCDQMGLRIVDIAARLKCSGEGCGSDDIAVFPHLYDGIWSWPPGDQAGVASS